MPVEPRVAATILVQRSAKCDAVPIAGDQAFVPAVTCSESAQREHRYPCGDDGCFDKDDSGGFDYELLFVKRHPQSRFLPNHYVFPGGLVENDDGAPDETLLSRQLNASVRELWEETGLMVGTRLGSNVNSFVPPPTSRVPASLFWNVYAEQGLQIPDTLIPFQRWITPESSPYRYDTMFVVAPERIDDAVAAQVSPSHETTKMAWVSPGFALSEYKAGRMLLPYTQLHILTQLLPYKKWTDVVALSTELSSHSHEDVMPVTNARDFS